MYVTSKNNNICPHYLSKDSISLIYAAKNRNANSGKEMAELLFDFGDPKLEHVNNEGKSALEIATELNNEEFVKFLLTKM